METYICLDSFARMSTACIYMQTFEKRHILTNFVLDACFKSQCLFRQCRILYRNQTVTTCTLLLHVVKKTDKLIGSVTLDLSVKRVDSLDVRSNSGLPRSGKNIWKMNFFPGQAKVRKFWRCPGKFRNDLKSQEKVRELQNKWLWQAVFRKLMYSFQKGKGCTFS